MLAVCSLLQFGVGAQPAATISINANQPGARVSPMLWGLFFEDINLSADGGIYAELVRNRSFEDAEKPIHWFTVSSGMAEVELSVDSEKPVSAKNPHALKVAVKDIGSGRAGVMNPGYWGMALKKGAQYTLSLQVRGEAAFSGPLAVTLESQDGVVYAEERINTLSNEWKQFSFALKSKGTDPRARLVISTTRPGTFWLDMVSLFPKETWKGHGMRADLMEMLAGLKPAFIRFPGGCWVEGETMDKAYRWKQTIGDISERRTQYNIWQYEATHGLGYHEYLQLCEDLGAAPLFVINCGMSHRENVPMEQMSEYVQDALDAIEYANGPTDSPWGFKRVQAGHAAPFNLRYLEIGNENGGPAYHERWQLFHKAIKARYPQMQLIANVWSGCPTNPMPDIVDEHYYSTPEFFMQQAGKYDGYDRKGPKIYVGEYAVTQGCGQGNLRGAIGEAAFMTGMERNGEVVAMASYAPLFANVNHKRWNPDLICYDSYRAYGLPSYYVQKLFAEHRGQAVLPVTVQAKSISSSPNGGALGVGTWLTQAEFKDLKVICNGQTLFSTDFADGTKGWKLFGGDWKVQGGVLQQHSLKENVRAIIGDKTWTNYTYTLKARKLGGAEGFLIPFRMPDQSSKSWWNLGGCGNTRHGIEIGGIVGREVPGRIELNRWYDIRLELADNHIKCFLDNQLIHDVVAPTMQSVYASATQDDPNREVIVKVVNTNPDPQATDIKLESSAPLATQARAWQLTSASGEDENTLTQPMKVAPSSKNLPVKDAIIHCDLPGNSFTVIRIKVLRP